MAKKSLTKSDRCAVTFSWWGNQLLVLNFSSFFLLTTTVRRRRIAMYISLFTVAIPVNDTSAFRESCKATTYSPTLIYNWFIPSQSPPTNSRCSAKSRTYETPDMFICHLFLNFQNEGKGTYFSNCLQSMIFECFIWKMWVGQASDWCKIKAPI